MNQSPLNFIYLGLFCLAFILSLTVHKYHKSFKILPYLLGAGLLTEVLVILLDENRTLVIYFFYLHIEVALTYYFYQKYNSGSRVKAFLKISVMIFFTCSIAYYFWGDAGAGEFLGRIYSVGCVLFITWGIVTLFSIEPFQKVPLPKLPIFWVCTGMIIFYSGIFTYNILNDYLKVSHEVLATTLNNVVPKIFNILLYSAYIIALLCSNQMKESSSH